MDKIYGYVIKVSTPSIINSYTRKIGFYTNCYQTSVNGERGTWIGFTSRDDEWNKIKQFKTYKAAENKLNFLKKKIDMNGYMWDWELSIEPILEEDL